MVMMDKETKIRTAAAYKGISHAKLAAGIGMTPPNFSQKLKRDTFTDEELERIAGVLGAEFIPCAFVFPDGFKV